MQTSLTGKDGEKLASRYLEGKGYEILEKNFRYKRGEIDLVAKKEGLLIFIEVKTRSGTGFGYPEEAVDEKKEEMVMDTADQYVYDKNWNGPIRFDIISILLKPSSEPEIMHFKDAFH